MQENIIIGVKSYENEFINNFFEEFRSLHRDYWIALRTAVLIVIKFFECKRCGNCCRYSPPSFKEHEAFRIAKYLGKDIKNLPLEPYLNIIGDEERLYYKAKAPCPFLKDNLCSVYPVRGAVCKSFPFEWLMYSLIPQYCRGVFDAIEKATKFIRENKDKIKGAIRFVEEDLRRFARDSGFKEKMREEEYKSLVDKLFFALSSTKNEPP